MIRRLWSFLHARYHRLRYCRRGQHRETLVSVYGELRMVCLDCPQAETLGHVYYGASNHAHPRR
jgi:hypothetical protein